MKWFGFGREQSGEPPDSETPAPGVRAVGDRAAAVGGNAGVIQTGDNSRVMLLPPEALRPMSEVDAPPGIDNLPLRPSQFVGRAGELDQLDVVLTDPGQVVVQAVHGLGGIGKSTLVAHWAATRAHGHTPIVWISADTAASVQQGLARFAAALQPVLAQVLEADQLAERALQWLATHRNWLLVLDNVDDHVIVAEVLARARAGRVVITSRRSSGWRPGTAIVRLGVLEPEESLRLLLGILATAGPRDSHGAAQLCCELGYLPLAIEQAGAYLAQNPFTTPQTYLRMLTDRPGEMHRRAAIGTDPERTIARIWRVTVERITTIEPRAADLLRALAWYGPDAIPLLLCEHIVGLSGLDASVGVLAAYSMVTPDPATDSVSMHRLVQAVARASDPGDPDRSRDAIQFVNSVAISALDKALPPGTVDNPQSWSTWRALLPHIDALAANTALDTTKIASVLLAAAAFLVYDGQYTRGIEYLQRAIFVREQLLGDDHPDTLSARTALGDAYSADDQFTSAIALHEQNLADTERVVGVDHPDALRIRRCLARAYSRAGRVDDGIAILEQTQTDHERVLGNDHSDTLEARHTLTSAYVTANRIGQAIALGERNLTDVEAAFGRDHPRFLVARHALASAYEAAGRIAEAVTLHERNSSDARRLLGPDHLDSLAIGESLSDAHVSAGRIEDAAARYTQNLDDHVRFLGAGHTRTLRLRRRIADFYGSIGRIEDALPLYEQNLVHIERGAGADHPDTLAMHKTLGDAYQSADRIDDAITQYERRLAATERVAGRDDPAALQIRYDLTSMYRRANRIEDSIAMAEQNLIDVERVFSRSLNPFLSARHALACSYEAAGRLAEAIPLYEQNVADAADVLGPDNPDAVTLGEALADAYRNAGRIEEAITVYEKNLVDHVRVFGFAHETTLTLRNSLAESYREVGRFEDMIALCAHNHTAREATLGDAHLESLVARNKLADAYLLADRPSEVIELYSRMRSDPEHDFGAEHPDTLIYRNNLARVQELRDRSGPPE
ncbi:tetratricopeptide repeat protein [Nocardia brasiliensis]|uniref:tetratricopeptide repeat protein n=1 Tax=Nocardia brasiliensis TaxID=37326 RepID=UPI0024583086|nr:tetratricopeptide repeat protein [Nocardia brasiliensis]